MGVTPLRRLYVLPSSKRWPAGTGYSEKCEFRCTQGEPSVHFGKIQVHFKKIGAGSGKAKLEEPVSHTHFRVSFLKG